jgi:hypothetical protein
MHVGEPLYFEAEYQFNDPHEWNAVQGGTLCLFVLTRALYRDKWGGRPEKTSCIWLNAKDAFKTSSRCVSGNN